MSDFILPQPAGKKTPWHLDPTRRQQHLDKMQAGRDRTKATQQSAPPPTPTERADAEPDYIALMRDLTEVRWDRIELSIGNSLMSRIDACRTEGLQRLQGRIERERGERCFYCQTPFINGRHAEMMSWHDPETNQPIGRRVCANQECRGKLQMDYNRIRMERLGQR